MESTNSRLNTSFFLRTSLDERVHIISGGRELIAITLLPKILPIAYPTIKNKISAGTFPFEVIRFNNKNFVRTADVIAVISNHGIVGGMFIKKIGRKSNKERMQCGN